MMEIKEMMVVVVVVLVVDEKKKKKQILTMKQVQIESGDRSRRRPKVTVLSFGFSEEGNYRNWKECESRTKKSLRHEKQKSGRDRFLFFPFASIHFLTADSSLAFFSLSHSLFFTFIGLHSIQWLTPFDRGKKNKQLSNPNKRLTFRRYRCHPGLGFGLRLSLTPVSVPRSRVRRDREADILASLTKFNSRWRFDLCPIRSAAFSVFDFP